jgi:hypothetical protein
MRRNEATANTNSLNPLADFELVAMLPFTLFQKPHCQGVNVVAVTKPQCNLWLDYIPLPGRFVGTVLPKSYELV